MGGLKLSIATNPDPDGGEENKELEAESSESERFLLITMLTVKLEDGLTRPKSLGM